MKPLESIKEGRRVTLCRIDAGRTMQRKLQALGLFVGDTVRVQRNNRGFLIVAKEDFRVALGRGMAGKIWVDETD
jgi:Fe2+ transport system protein FeoA